jgi:hypothetical protein
MSYQVQTVALNFDGISNTSRPGFQVPTAGGGITIIGAALEGAGTGTYRLVTLSNVGTPAVDGTIATTPVGGTVTAGVVNAFTITNGWVAAGKWVGVTETNVGASTRTRISISYVMGRANF